MPNLEAGGAPESTPKNRSGRWKADDAKAVLEAWEQSGLPLKDFARQQGLEPQRLYLWRRRLMATPASTTRFEEVTVQRRAPAAELSAIEVVLRTGLVIRVGPSFDACALRRLIAVLDNQSVGC